MTSGKLMSPICDLLTHEANALSSVVNSLVRRSRNLDAVDMLMSQVNHRHLDGQHVRLARPCEAVEFSGLGSRPRYIKPNITV